MKPVRLLSCFLALLLMFSFVSASVVARTDPAGVGMYTVNGITYRTFHDGTAAVSKGNSYHSGTVEIPLEVEGYIVTSIGDYSFQNCTKIQEIVLPATISHIGYSAFYGCAALESINIPDTIEEIEYAAFAKCTSLKSAKIADLAAWCAARIDGPAANPAHIIGKLDFGISMQNFVIPSYIGEVGAYAFYGCKDIASVEISEGITKIGECAFYGCENLTDINVPKSVTEIEDGAFSDCDKLSVVDVSTDNAYYKNLEGALVEIETKTLIRGFNNTVIPTDGSIVRVGAYAFSGCDNIVSITLPDCIEFVGASAFKDCKKLASVTLPNGLGSINSALFSGCGSLKDFVIPESVTRVGSNAFRYCDSLTSIKLHDKITEVGDFAFADCKSLQALHLPASVKKLGDGVVSGSTAVTSLTAEGGTYYSVNNCIIRSGSVVAGCITSRIPDDNSVSMINTSAFANQTGLTQVLIPLSVKSIGRAAFDGCTALANVYYGGDDSDWRSIKTGTENLPLSSAQKLYNNTDMPEISIPNAGGSSGNASVGGNNGNVLWIVLIAVAVILIAGAVVTVIIIKRKKSK